MSFLGVDRSGNGNNFTATNLATTDVVLDSPTNNFATLNPLNASSTTLSEGNTKYVAPSSAYTTSLSTIGMTSGKWYCEGLFISGSYSHFGISKDDRDFDTWLGNDADAYTYYLGGQKYNNGSPSSYGASYTSGDIIGVAYNGDDGTLTFYKNGTSQGTAFTGLSGEFFFGTGMGYSSTAILNFGQDSSFAGTKTAQGNTDSNNIGDFYYTPPSGYLALCTANLPDPAVIPSEHFNTVLWTGNGSTNNITGVGFQPDWVWLKSRSTAQNNYSIDAVRGVNNIVAQNNTNAESTYDSTWRGLYGNLTSFDTDGFTVVDGTDGTYDSFNGSGDTYVAWNWKANGSGVSNTDGTITSTVSANQDAGFSIVSYTESASSAFTVGHGLNNVPEMVIVRPRTVSSWFVYNSNLANPNDEYLFLNTTAGVVTSAGFWSTGPTSSLISFSIGFAGGRQSIAYCFHSVDGFSKVGSYTGNGSADGAFVYTGFKPAFVMIKVTGIAGYNWYVFDSDRSEYNEMSDALFPNSSSSEYSPVPIDFLSNGFKLRTTDGGVNNSSYSPYIYIAFAEVPAKFSNGR